MGSARGSAVVAVQLPQSRPQQRLLKVLPGPPRSTWQRRSLQENTNLPGLPPSPVSPRSAFSNLFKASSRISLLAPMVLCGIPCKQMFRSCFFLTHLSLFIFQIVVFPAISDLSKEFSVSLAFFPVVRGGLVLLPDFRL